MESIVNNLKYYQNPWNANSIYTSQYQFGVLKNNRNTIPKTETSKHKRVLQQSKLKLQYFQDQYQTPIKSASNFEMKKTQTTQQKSPKARNGILGRTRKSIFSKDDKQSRYSRNKDANSVKKSATNMKINELFFCQKCYLYLFRIELDFHYPHCNSNFNDKKLSKQISELTGQSKLCRLEYTIKYTNFFRKDKVLKQIQNIRNKKYSRKYFNNCEDRVLQLQDAQLAVDLIYCRFFL